MARPLEGIKVLDLTWVLSGPFATMILSDLGAEVIKIEKPGSGDFARGTGPFVKDISTYFLSLNRGKKSVTLDLASERGREILLSLVKQVDIIVENYVPGTMKKLGLSYETIKEHNPRIIYAACSGFGQTGPYVNKPAFDVIVQAMGGIMSLTGEPGRPPVRVGVSLGDIAAGLFLAIAILAALQERNKSGQGQMIDIGMMDCQLAIMENAVTSYFATGELPRALGTRHPSMTPFQVFPTKDGYVAVATRGGEKDQWPLFLSVIDRIDMVDDERFKTGWLRTQNYEKLEPMMNEAMKKRPTAEWLKEFEAVGIPCGPVNTVDKVVNDPQVVARRMIAEVHQPGDGTFKVVNTPLKFSRTICNADQPAPALGEHTETVLKSFLKITPDQIKDLRDAKVI
jgi:CoA:oxalate CoA-transferase